MKRQKWIDLLKTVISSGDAEVEIRYSDGATATFKARIDKFHVGRTPPYETHIGLDVTGEPQLT